MDYNQLKSATHRTPHRTHEKMNSPDATRDTYGGFLSLVENGAGSHLSIIIIVGENVRRQR